VKTGYSLTETLKEGYGTKRVAFPMIIVIIFVESNYFSQLLNVHRVSDVRQIEIHTAEPLVPDPSPFEFEIAIAKLKRYKSPGSEPIPAELIQARGEILRSKIRN
jgi:hypothetical protein